MTVAKRERRAVLMVTHLHVKQGTNVVKETNVSSRVAQRARPVALTHSRVLVKMTSSAKTNSVWLHLLHAEVPESNVASMVRRALTLACDVALTTRVRSALASWTAPVTQVHATVDGARPMYASLVQERTAALVIMVNASMVSVAQRTDAFLVLVKPTAPAQRM